MPKFRASILTNPPDGVPLNRHILATAADYFRGHYDDSSDAANEELALLRKLCREGNPFPLIARQWPSLLIRSTNEARYFEGHLGRGGNTDEWKPHPTDPCLRLDRWQRQIIAAFFDDSISEIAIKGCTKAGKGMCVGLCINLWFDVFDAAKIILCSATFAIAVENIFGEAVKWRRTMERPGAGNILREAISDNDQHYIIVKNPQTGEAFSGQHGPRTLFCFDEASGVSRHLYDNSLKQARKIVALSNPRTLFSWFRSLYDPCEDIDKTQVVNSPNGRRFCVTISGDDCINVREKRLEKPIAPITGLTFGEKKFGPNEPLPPAAWERLKPLIPDQVDYGRHQILLAHHDPNQVAWAAHGKFPTEDVEKQVILNSWLKRHFDAYDSDAKPITKAFGLDIARSLDGDMTCLAAGSIYGLAYIHKWQFDDTTFHVSEVLRIAEETYGINLREGYHPVCVDMDGIGAGVGDMLKQQGVWVIEFRGNATSEADSRTYFNLRAEAYGLLARRLNPLDQWGQTSFPMWNSDMLAEELCAPERIYMADGLRWKITPKNRHAGMKEDEYTIHDKIGRSPDEGDSLAYLFHAARLQDDMDAFYRSAAAPLVVSPAPDPHRPNPHDRCVVAPTDANLLDWIQSRYGGGNVGGSDRLERQGQNNNSLAARVNRAFFSQR